MEATNVLQHQVIKYEGFPKSTIDKSKNFIASVEAVE